MNVGTTFGAMISMNETGKVYKWSKSKLVNVLPFSPTGARTF